MQKRNGGQVIGILTFLVVTSTAILCFLPILFIGILKLIPYKRWRNRCSALIDEIATIWCGFNKLYLHRVQNIRWEVTGLNNLTRKDWYLVIANHQSWLDIVVLHQVFNRKIPVLKFFIKDQLKWIPFLGFAWWIMGCPFMKRYDKKYLEKKPHKQGKDLQTIKKAMERFKDHPASIMNFVEGTRFTPQKNQTQNSPYTHLLKPKAGGLSFIINAMGEQIHSLLDVTIIYPQANHSLWDCLCRRVKSIKVNIRQLPIPPEFRASTFLEDAKAQSDFKTWINQHWTEKDLIITSLK